MVTGDELEADGGGLAVMVIFLTCCEVVAEAAPADTFFGFLPPLDPSDLKTSLEITPTAASLASFSLSSISLIALAVGVGLTAVSFFELLLGAVMDSTKLWESSSLATLQTFSLFVAVPPETEAVLSFDFNSSFLTLGFGLVGGLGGLPLGTLPF